MSFLNKLKKVFYDDVVDEDEEFEKVKKGPVKKDKTDEFKLSEDKKSNDNLNTYTERELFKTEPTFKFPLIDEEDEEKEEINQSRRETTKKHEDTFNKRSVSKINYGNMSFKKDEKKTERTFRPSPIISPVYGILDKNYNKEDIVTKSERSNIPIKEFNYDYVRRKAYGTLEDDLQNTLTNIADNIENNNEKIEKMIIDEKGCDDNKSIEELLVEIEESASVSIGELEEKIKDKNELEEEKIEKKEEKIIEEAKHAKDNEEEIEELEDKSVEEDKTLEHDLFNLIDLMYEDKEGE